MTRNKRAQFTALASVLAGSLVLHGCAALKRPAPAPEPTPAVASQPVQVKPLKLPNVKLDAPLLFTLLSAEMAGYRNQLGVATVQYLDAARSTRDPRVIERAVRVANYAGLYKEGLEAARLWVEVVPGSDKAQRTLAALLLKNGHKDEALAAFDRLLKEAKDLDQAFLHIGKLLIREGNRSLSLELMQQLTGHYPKNAAGHYVLSSLAEQGGRLKLAESAVRQALVLKPGWTEAQKRLARILHLQGDTKGALAYLAGVLEATPDNITIRLSYARLLVDDKQLDRARKQFEKLANASPDNIDILFALGILALQTEDYDSAELYLGKVSEGAGRRSMEALYYLGQIAEQREQPDRAIGWYNKITEGEYVFDARLRSAHLVAGQGHVEAAMTVLEQVSVRGEAQRVRLALAKGEILREAKRFADAMKVFDRALIDLPGNSDLLYARALMAERVNRLDILMRDLKAILKVEPDNAHALNALGYTLADRTGQYKEALEYISRALKLSPDDASIIDSMGWVQYRLGNYDEALKHLTRAYDLNDDAEIAAHLGEVLWAMGEKARARKVWRRGLEHAPNDERLLEVIRRFDL